MVKTVCNGVPTPLDIEQLNLIDRFMRITLK